MYPWLSWIERLATDQKVGGSNPSGYAKKEAPHHKVRRLFFGIFKRDENPVRLSDTPMAQAKSAALLVSGTSAASEASRMCDAPRAQAAGEVRLAGGAYTASEASSDPSGREVYIDKINFLILKA